MKQMITSKQLSAMLSVLLLSPYVAAQDISTHFKGAIDVSLTNPSNMKAWHQQGWGIARFDKGSNQLGVSRAVLSTRVDLSSAWSAHGVAQYVADPKDKFGLTEAYAQYQPLAQGYQFSARIGGFYPRMSLENPALGWASPYTYHYSALNAWLGEEVRTFGAEFELKRAARRFRSKHDISMIGAIFKGNDPAGTLIAWRGFVPHDRQSVFNERIGFAPLKSLSTPQLRLQGQYVEPFTEIDGRFGYYTGLHWSYLKRHNVRLYWYDNNGDPSAINYVTKQYAWDTKFWSLAWRAKLSAQSQVIMQAMLGNTAMGLNRGVDNDFYSWFVMFSHTFDDYRVSAKAEQSKVIDKDFWQFDENASFTQGATINVQKSLSEKWQLGAELQFIDYEADARLAVGRTLGLDEQIWRITAQYQF
ncbi:hypothetical protein PSECIP111951_03862 [Pseudoalteromonas holothuriae]|uniref:Porin n=1 Tax=Pseudoalteromonas holothuriae TaxID=2963714 RepID=A0A9W4R4W8_9GAMM|nr:MULTISPECIES: hypothetical protein [unclassified Pseudoalteromonas]CAH9066681.1 hypothetical protein PSECIP111854_03938 [Pseudoalteromonas sp. CIP111854]CAH9067675.1 hypothetical protein PSECIP111951_03862 [Pseudoalteromonas sp. CIP111951]